VASASQGRRCPEFVQVESNGHEQFHIQGREGYNVISAQRPSVPDECFVKQRCRKHLRRDAPDVAAPSWELFDPARDSDLVHSNPIEVWTPEGVRVSRWAASEEQAMLESYIDTVEHDRLTEALIEARENRVKPPAATALYTYHDADGEVLYVGITDNLTDREFAHVKKSSWMQLAAGSNIERFPTREQAEAEEKRRIKALRPLFNSQHNDDPAAPRRLVEYLIRQGRTDLLAPAVSRG
jgi:predicted GIY-YIG superfamily endonuclease